MGYEPRPQPEIEPEPKDTGEGAADRLSRPAPGDLLGQTLGDRYRFDELLGEGTFARVYRVYDLHRRASLAAKVLRSDIAHEPAFLERFQREAVVLAKLQHPHIVRYYDIVEGDGYVFILTDHISGETLQSLLRKRKAPMSPLDSLAYLTPLMAALHYAHEEGVVHRDLKPANILLSENGTLYVMDFGIARILSDASTLTMDTAVGTPHYMSPEQVLSGEITAATDIYAMGIILYQMYAGVLPFRGETPGVYGSTTAVRIAYEHLHVQPESPRSLNPRLNQEVEDVILRCLAKDPSQRYGSMSQLYDALTAAIGTPSVALDSGQLAGVRSVPEPAPSVVEPEAERVPTGVGGVSQIVPEEEIEGVWELDKPKRKAKRQPQRRPPQNEKDREKQRESEEKEAEKKRESDEKEAEKGQEKLGADWTGEFWGDIAPSDRLSQFSWGAMLLWAGIVFLLNNAEATRNLFSDPWAWIFSGAGSILLIEVAARLAIPEFRSRPGARLVLGVVLLMIGLGVGINFGLIWPLILIAIGISILFNHLTNR